MSTVAQQIQARLGEIEDITMEHLELQDRVTISEDLLEPEILAELRSPPSASPPPDRSALLYRVLVHIYPRNVPVPEHLRPDLPTWTVDYLLRLIYNYWNTGSDHPALTAVETEASEGNADRKFKLYVRIFASTSKDRMLDLLSG